MTDATATYTPGPWWRDDDGFIAAGSGDSYVTIADFDCSDDIDPDEREANKSLAMAAPAMRAALSDALAFMPGAFDGGEDEINGGDLVEWFSGWREQAKEALAATPSAAPPAPSDALALADVLDDTDVATILAALRFYQEKGQGEPFNRSDAIHDIATAGDTLTSLDDAGIDDLCERINCGAQPPAPADPVNAEMLAALKAIRDDLKAGGWDGLYDEARQIGISGAMSLVVSAIARAEGRA